MSQTVVGVFGKWEQAAAAVSALRQVGFTSDHVSVVAREEVRQPIVSASADQERKDATVGAMAGGAIGAAGGLAVGMSLFAFPALGALIAAGPLLTTLLGMAAGAAAGSLAGALIGSGIPQDRAPVYEEAIREGKVVVVVHAGSYGELARQVLDNAGSTDIHVETGLPDPDEKPLSSGMTFQR